MYGSACFFVCNKRPCETTTARKELPKTETLLWVSFAFLSHNEVNLPRCKFPWELERRCNRILKWVSTWDEWNSRDKVWIERKRSQFSVTFSMPLSFSYRTSLSSAKPQHDETASDTDVFFLYSSRCNNLETWRIISMIWVILNSLLVW